MNICDLFIPCYWRTSVRMWLVTYSSWTCSLQVNTALRKRELFPWRECFCGQRAAQISPGAIFWQSLFEEESCQHQPSDQTLISQHHHQENMRTGDTSSAALRRKCFSNCKLISAQGIHRARTRWWAHLVLSGEVGFSVSDMPHKFSLTWILGRT